MSYCINIFGLEHLPEEETLLIHYMIGCTGVWYLSQLLTAYRGVCDDEWTVMYPNHQHPRHTDFPISVTSPGYNATFAWNYGGIQGISSEDFDSYHSYLVQLSIFEYGCYNTGGPVISGSTTGEDPTTSTGFPGDPQTGIQPPITGGGGGGNPPDKPTLPRVIDPPFPGGAGGGGGQPGGGGQAGEPPNRVVNKPVSGESSGQPPALGRVINDKPASQGTGEPTGIVNTSTIGMVQPNTTYRPYNNAESTSTVHQVQTRPDGSVGGTQNPYVTYYPLNRDVYIPSDPGTLGEPQILNVPDLNTSHNTSTAGTIPGILNASITVHGGSSQPSIGQVNIPNIEYNSFISVQVLNTEVTIGQPIVVSAVFQPPTALQARMQIILQDESTSVVVSETGLLSVSNSSPLTCGGSYISSSFNLGNVSVICKVLDSNNLVIGIHAMAISLTEPINEGTYQSSKVTVGEELPAAIINANDYKLNTQGIPISLKENESKYLIFYNSEEQTVLSAVLKTKYTSEDFYSLSIIGVYDEAGAPSREFSEYPSDPMAPIGGDRTTKLDIESSPKYIEKFKINNVEVYPSSHTVAISNEAITPTNLFVLEIAPTSKNVRGDTEGILYISENFTLRPISFTVAPTVISGQVPFAGERYGLIINGYDAKYIAPSTEASVATSTSHGEITWSLSSPILQNQYFSVIQQRNGIINPFDIPVYTGRYTL